jgi:hypothetical protein
MRLLASGECEPRRASVLSEPIRALGAYFRRLREYLAG